MEIHFYRGLCDYPIHRRRGYDNEFYFFNWNSVNRKYGLSGLSTERCITVGVWSKKSYRYDNSIFYSEIQNLNLSFLMMMMMMMMIWTCVYHTEKTIAVGDALCAFCDEYDKPEEQLECKKKMCSSVWDDFTKLLIKIILQCMCLYFIDVNKPSFYSTPKSKKANSSIECYNVRISCKWDSINQNLIIITHLCSDQKNQSELEKELTRRVCM